MMRLPSVKVLFLSIFILSTSFFASSAFAVVYQAGTTLSPGCAPSDSSCGVTKPVSIGDSSSTSTIPAGSMLVYSASSTWDSLPMGLEGQVLKVSSGTIAWGSSASSSSPYFASGEGLSLSTSTGVFSIILDGSSLTQSLSGLKLSDVYAGQDSINTVGTLLSLSVAGTSSLGVVSVSGITATQSGLTLLSSTPASTTNTLYAVGSNLNWNGQPVITGTETDPLWMSASSSYLSIAGASSDYLSKIDAGLNYVATSSFSSYITNAISVASGQLSSVVNGVLSTSTIRSDDVLEGVTNQYFTPAKARSSLSLNALGLTYSTTSGQLALQFGYEIPLTASTTNWNGFYNTPSTRISLNQGLAWNGNMLGLDMISFPEANATQKGIVSTTTQIFAGDKTFNNSLTVLGTTTLSGAVNIGTDISAGSMTVTSQLGVQTGMSVIGNVDGWYQLIVQNKNFGASASSDFVVQANNGTGEVHYVDMGINGVSGGAVPFSGVNAAYYYSASDDLHIGALGSGSALSFYASSSDVAKMIIASDKNTLSTSYFTGNVGIGSSTPSTALVVVGTSTLNDIKGFSLNITGVSNLSTTTVKGLTILESGLTLLSSTPASTTNALYAVGSNLNWNGQPVITGTETDPLWMSASSSYLSIAGASSDYLSKIDAGLNYIATSSFSSYITNAISVASGQLSSVVNGVLSTSTIRSDDVLEGVTNQYFTPAKARSSLSLNAQGLTYSTTSGQLALQFGYEIPLTASTTNWNGFYNTPSTRISAGSGLSWNINSLSLDINSLASKSGSLDGDELVVYDSTLPGIRKITKSGFLNGLTNSLSYKGIWNAASNTPTLINGVGGGGYMYISSTASTTVDLGSGPLLVRVGDMIIYNTSSSAWEVAPSGNSVVSAFGRTGVINASLGDYNASMITHATSSGLPTETTVQQALNTLGGFYNTPSTRISLNQGLAWNGNMLGLDMISFPEANATQKGIVSTTTQIFAGDKTFNNSLTVLGTTTLSGAVNIGTDISAGSMTVTSQLGVQTGMSVIGNVDGWYQLIVQNKNFGASASSDFVVQANNGTDEVHYVDMGINGISGGAIPFSGVNAAYYYSASDDLHIGALGSGSALSFYASSSDVAKMIIASDKNTLSTSYFTGNVGIGSSTPSTALVVVGTSTLNDIKGFSLNITGVSNLSTTTAKGLTILESGLTLLSSTPASTTNALYAVGSNLNWNGQPVITGTETDPLWMSASSSYLSIAGASSDYLSKIDAGLNYVATSSFSSYITNAISVASGQLSSVVNGVLSTSTIRSDDVLEGVTNQYFTPAKARSSLSLNAQGLTYSTTSGQLALQFGYEIPLTASTTNWNGFYNTPSTRISLNQGLAWNGNMLGLDMISFPEANATQKGIVSTTTQIFAGDKTFNNSLTVLGTTTLSGAVNIGTDISAGSMTVTSQLGVQTGMSVIGNVDGWYQLMVQNKNFGTSVSSDFVVSANNGTDSAHYVDMGINGVSGGAVPFAGVNAAYYYSASDDLHIGALGSGSALSFYASSSDVAKMIIASDKNTLSTSYFTGNVGIGSSTPSTALVVVGTSTLNDIKGFSLNITGVSNLSTTTVKGLTILESGLTLLSSTPASTTNTLYAVGSNLNWNGQPVITGTETDPLWMSASSSYLSIAGASSDYLSKIDAGLNYIATSSFSSYITNAISVASGQLSSVVNGVLSTSTIRSDDVLEGVTNQYFTPAKARSSLSLNAQGLTYSTTSGQLALQFGYEIPLTASTTNWNGFYNTPSTRISLNQGLAWNGNMLGLDMISFPEANATQKGIVSTTTQIFAGDKTFNNSLTVLGTTTLSGAVNIGTDISAGSMTVTSQLGVQTGMSVIGNVDGWYQLIVQNKNFGASASSDFVVQANNGTGEVHYVDMGINGVSGGAVPFSGVNAAYYYSASDDLHIGALGSGSALSFYASSSDVAKMIIASDKNTLSTSYFTGNVGIGSSTPSTALVVVGTSTLTSLVLSSGLTGASVIFSGNATTTGYQYIGGALRTAGISTFATTSISSLTVTSTSTLQGISGTNMTLSGNSTTTGNQYVVGTLNSTGLSYFSTSSITALSVTGTSTLSGISGTSLSISGLSTFSTTTVRGLSISQNGLTLSSSTPFSTTNSLYNLGGTLMWNGATAGISGGQYGYLSYWSSGNTISTSTMYYSTSTGYYGIGTTTPSSMFEIAGGDGALLGLSRSSEGQWVNFKDGTRTFSIYNTNSTSSPEGVKLANTGSLMINSISGNMYLKTTNSTTTGWQKIQREADVLNRVNGWVEGGTITINAGTTTKIDISAGSVELVDYTAPNFPVVKRISWPNQVGLNPALATRSKWVGVRDDGTGNAQFVFDVQFDSIERRDVAIIGKIWNSTGTGPSITNIDHFRRPAYGLLTAVQDFFLEYGSWSISGNEISPNGANMLLDKSAGKSFRYEAERIKGQENVHTDIALAPVTTYAYHLNGIATTTATTSIDTYWYSNNGVKAALANNRYAVEEVYFFPVSNTIHVRYGTAIFNSLALAEAANYVAPSAVNADVLDGSIRIATIIVRGQLTNLTTAISGGTAKIILRNGVGSGGGGAAATSYWGRSGVDLSPTTLGDDLLLPSGSTLTLSAMSTGSLAFFSGGGLVSQDNANIFWDDSNNRLGIGTSSPQYMLSMGTGGGYYNQSTGAWTNGSDQNYKDNITDLSKYGLDTINALRPVSYVVKQSGVDQIGFIAQEVKGIIPELVSGEDGSMGLNYGGFTPVLAKAMQEQNRYIFGTSSDAIVFSRNTFPEGLALAISSAKSEIDLIKDNIASSTSEFTSIKDMLSFNLSATSTKEVASSTNSFIENISNWLISWLSDAKNGVLKLFAKSIETEEICVGDGSGEKTCITKVELDALLKGAKVNTAASRNDVNNTGSTTIITVASTTASTAVTVNSGSSSSTSSSTLEIICNLPKVLNNEKTVCVDTVLTCEEGKVLNETKDKCITPTPVCANGQVLNEAKDACVTPAPLCSSPQILSQTGDVCINPPVIKEETKTPPLAEGV